MTHIQVDRSLFARLENKVVVITGGSTGIGKSAVKQFQEHGAKVVFGDVSTPNGEALEAELGDSVAFVRCDVTSYQQQLQLFAVAEESFGGIDIVVANAGISDPHDVFDPSVNLQDEPSLKEIDVNLKGVIYTAKIGMFYLRKRGGGSLVLVSSIAGFKESPAMTPYGASKHGVIGVLRGLRMTAINENIFVNAICPWMTTTAMVAGIRKGWKALGLPENEPEDVARSILICTTAETSTKASVTHSGAAIPFSGKILYVAGGESYEIEDGIQSLESTWLGKENSEVLQKGQDFLTSEETSWVPAGAVST